MGHEQSVVRVLCPMGCRVGRRRSIESAPALGATRPTGSGNAGGDSALFGKTVSHYQILEKLGSGGAGDVYLARDQRLDRMVALKVLPQDMAADPERLERFEQEARVLASLNHPNIITIYSVEEASGLRFLTMELVEGATLADVIPTSGLSVERFFQVAVPLAAALDAAHAKGIVHRDLKPANVMVGREGRIKVLDFGLARQRSDPSPTGAESRTKAHTAKERVEGTLPYMSPEQLQGKAIDPRSDLFSLGVILFEMATGERPFQGETAPDLISAILRDPAKSVLDLKAELPPALGQLIRQCLEKNPQRRFASAHELFDELEQLSAEPWSAEHETERPSVLIGRQAELSRLMHCLDQARVRRRRQVIFITGEAGAGKTALLDDFLARLGAQPSLSIAYGHCQELYGAGEAYMPVFEAVDRLCRSDEHRDVVHLLDRHAPTWLAQMPGHLTEAEAESLKSRVAGSTSERMLREFALAVESLTAESPLVLLIEDLHWSDYSTLDLVSALARRQEPARLLVVVTCRPTEVLDSKHPLKAIHQDLKLRKLIVDLPLEGLSTGAVGEYLYQRLGTKDGLEPLVDRLVRLTEGNPLFLVNTVDHLLDRGYLAQSDGRWQLTIKEKELGVGIPDSLRHVIQEQIELLDEEEQNLLAVSSVAGLEFSAAVSAFALGQKVSEVVMRLESLVRRGQLLRSVGEEEWPDGTLAERYSFIHSLYQNVLYQRPSATQRVDLHHRIGERLEQAYGDRADEIAAVLAVHFERGRDAAKAVRYLGSAARNALRRAAPREATDHLRRALAQLPTLPPNRERDAQEIELQTTLGAAVSARRGYSIEEAQQAFSRVESLYNKLEGGEASPYVLWGLWTFYVNGAKLDDALKIGHRLTSVAEARNDPLLRTLGHSAIGVPCFLLGDHQTARQHIKQGLALDRLNRDSSQAMLTVDARVLPLCPLVQILWHLGYPDQAQECNQRLLEAADQISHPSSLAFALIWSCRLHQLRGEVEAVKKRARQIISLSEDHGLYFVSLGNVLLGWAMAEESASLAMSPAEIAERGASALRQIRSGLEPQGAPGTGICHTYFLSLLVETYAGQGHYDDARRVLDLAFSAMEESGERFWEPELHRLRGRLILTETPGEAVGSDRHRDAEGSFEAALRISRLKQDRSLELRAALSLARLWASRGEELKARDLLAGIHGWFREGFDTRDLRNAGELLRTLGC